MLLSDVADASAEVAATSLRTAKVMRVARVLGTATPQELPVVVTWLAGDLRQRRTGLGWTALRDAPPPATTATLHVLEVDDVLTHCEQLGGTGSRTARIALLHGLLARATATEHRLIAGLVTGELRQGAAQGVLLDAVATAAQVPTPAVRRAVTLTGDVVEVAAAVLAAAADDRPAVLSHFGLTVGQPLSPMLAQSAATVGEALARTGPAAVEWKLDGVRVQIHRQIHRQMDEVRIWTRTLDEVTARLPEVVERVRALPVSAVVLDGEVIALLPDGRPRPFQETAARVATRRPGGAGSVDVPVSTVLFDVLHLDGEDLVDVAASHRRLALESIAAQDLPVPRLQVPVVDDTGVDAAQAFADDALAKGHEGVVVKALDAPYAMGRRGAAWVKVKPRITLDLVVLAAEWGHGRRTGWLSNLHLGARDPQGSHGPPGGFVMLGKTFKGMTDELLRWQTVRLQELATESGGELPGGRPPGAGRGDRSGRGADLTALPRGVGAAVRPGAALPAGQERRAGGHRRHRPPAVVGAGTYGGRVTSADLRADVHLDLRTEATTALRRLVGRDDVDFRDGQWESVRSLVEDRARVLVVQRTGWGKSAVYFVATALLRARGRGPTLIVSPLLALMRDQVAAAQRAGVRAVSINSANPQEWAQVARDLDADAVDVLLVSPERLNNPRFRAEQLPRLASGLGLLVVDEAHCVSDWGHDFRPDYRRIRDLLCELPAGTPVLATTATANARVVQDVVEQLAAGPDGKRHEVATERGPLARESLRLGVLALPDAQTRLAWLAEHLPDLPGSGIVYCLTVAAAQDVAAFLRQRGLDVLAYTGRTDPAERPAAEQALRENRVKALVATSALGMGFDKPDLGFVVHVGSPSSPIAYYQQVGRAGRATERADVLLLPGHEDRDIWRYLASVSMPRQEQADAVIARLASAGRPLSTAVLETAVDVRRTRLELLLKVLDVEGAVQRVGGGWISTGQPWRYDAARYERVAAARSHEQQAMVDYLALVPGRSDGSACRMEFLARQLDDPWATACGRCDGCAGPWYPTQVSESARAAAGAQLDRVGVELEPRVQWPTGMDRLGVPVKGKIGEEERAGTGRALARLSDLGVGARLRSLLAPPAPDGGTTDKAVPEDVVQHCIATLRDWGWSRRPVAVAWVPSRRHPQLLASWAERLAGLGRLELLGPLELVDGGPTGEPGGNSAFRLAGVWGRIAVPAPWRSRLVALDGPVLLLDDIADSRWTITVAAAELRRGGAQEVLPFALALAN